MKTEEALKALLHEKLKGLSKAELISIKQSMNRTLHKNKKS